MKTNLNASWGTNAQLEKNGVWYTVHYEDDGTEVQFLITSTSSVNTKYMQAVETETRKYRSMTKMPLKLTQSLAKKCFINNCVLGWRNVLSDGKELPFSLDNAKALFDDMPHLLELLMIASNDSTNFQDGDVEGDAKNLPSA